MKEEKKKWEIKILKKDTKKERKKETETKK